MNALWLSTAFEIFIFVALLVSWVGTIIPIFPGPTVMWVLMLIYGIVSGFDRRGIILFGVITLLSVVALFSDNVFSIKGARDGGAAWSSVAIASLVGIVSSVFLTPIIGILLTLLTLYLVEFGRLRDSDKAMQATKLMLLGWGWATVARMGLGFINLGLWSAWAWL